MTDVRSHEIMPVAAKTALVLFAVFACVSLASSAALALSGSCNSGAIFADVVCTLQSTLDKITKDMFEAIAENLKGAILGALTLFIIFFGLAFLAGLISLTAREFAVMLFKFGLVWNFAAFWDMGAGFAYDFFKTFALNGGDMVWKAVGASGSGIGGITSIDSDITKAVTFSSGVASGKASDVAAVTSIDPVCVAQLTALAVFMFIMQPPLLGFVFIYIFNLLKLFATAILYYFKSLVLISFLIVFSPIFVSFALFQRTRELFETWLKHLATNALQMLIMFAFFAMVMLVDFASFFTELFSLFKRWNPLGGIGSSFNLGFGAINIQSSFCSLCDYTVTANYDKISCNGSGVLPPFAIPFQFDFWMWFATKIIALQVLSYILTDFLKKSPQIAQQLGGVRYGGLLAGSGRNPGFAGYTNILFASIENGAAAFKQAQRNAYYRPGIIGAIPMLNLVRNPLTPLTHAGNTLKSLGVALGASEQQMGIRNLALDPFQKEVDDYSKRALESKRAMQKAERILNHQQQLYKDGKVPRAALVSAQNAYNQASINSKRWERKLEESREKLLHQEERYASSSGALTTLKESLKGGHLIDNEYKMIVNERGGNSDHAAMAFFTPMGSSESALKEDQHERNLERMQSYAQSQIDASFAKLDRSPNIPSDVRSRIERQLSSASNDVNSGDMDRLSQCLDNLRDISRELD